MKQTRINVNKVVHLIFVSIILMYIAKFYKV